MQFLASTLALLAASAASVASAPHGELSSDIQAGSEMMLARNPGAVMPRSLDEEAAEELRKRIVYNPKIILPKADTVWEAGSVQRVTWETSDLPAELKQAAGMVKLGYLEPGSINEHLSLTLAKDFLLRSGQVLFDLPANVTARSNAM